MKALLILLLLIPGLVFPQAQEAKVLAYNVGFGGITAGVGAALNKRADENWRTAFVRGLWQGSIGGALNYSAKKTVHLVNKNDNLSYALAARVLSAAGSSIIQNAAVNGPFLKVWHFDYGFLRFDYSANAQAKFRVRVLPLSVIESAVAIPQGRLDLNATLLTGVMTFRSDELINTISGRHDGVNYGRVFVYSADTMRTHILSHELIHEFQYREFMVFNAYLQKPVSGLQAPRLKNVFTKYIYPDVPYFGLFYMLEGVERNSARYYRNYFEFEAERFSTNRHVHLE